MSAKRKTSARTVATTTPELLARKRDGGELSPAEITALIERFVAGEAADYQLAAFAMAVYLRGMSARETAALTLAMRDSGRRADLSAVRGKKVDKHSTGGVGDKISICLAPIVAACGVRVPMISGRGLGHTGGTLDKLEAIPGFRVNLPLRRFEQLVARYGFALIGQTADLAPADRRLYALRDVTATVESIPLITASILSKKLCEDLDALVLDLKVGRGAFMKTEADARALGESIISVGAEAGVPVTAVLTRMDVPLGLTIGNALETREALEVLHGGGPADVVECTYVLGAEMLRAAGVEATEAAAVRRLRDAVRSGAAAKLMRALIAAQGGDARVVDEPDRLPKARVVVPVTAARAGYVRTLDALALGQLCVRIGAGRTRADQAVDPSVGIVLHHKPGDAVRKGDTLAELHLADRTHEKSASATVLEAFTLGARPPATVPLVLDVLRGKPHRR